MSMNQSDSEQQKERKSRSKWNIQRPSTGTSLQLSSGKEGISINININVNPSETTKSKIALFLETCWEYFNALRPVTIIQAVGALVVGRLTLLSSASTIAGAGARASASASAITSVETRRLIIAAVSVYLSYGSGMVMNDIVDIDLDSNSSQKDKKDRAIASGRISKRSSMIYCSLLCIASLLLGNILGNTFAAWTASNMVLMLGYALGLQNVLLVKNAVCGWLAISPLIGATILSGCDGSAVSASSSAQLQCLAMIGFFMHFSREILKDIEDIDIDRGKKLTIPLFIGETNSHRLAYGIVAMVFMGVIFTPYYWNTFACSCKIPIYPMSVVISLAMCTRASLLELCQGQRLLKKSIYVTLAGMIGALLIGK